MIKQRTNAGLPINLYYWRDKTGHEIDVIIDEAGELTPIAIKAGKTINTEYFKNLIYWNNLNESSKGYLLYTGDERQVRSNGIEVMDWKQFIHH